MVGELMMFAATEAVVFVATALVFSGPDPVEDEEQILREELAEEAGGWHTPARSPRLDGVVQSL